MNEVTRGLLADSCHWRRASRSAIQEGVASTPSSSAISSTSARDALTGDTLTGRPSAKVGAEGGTRVLSLKPQA